MPIDKFGRHLHKHPGDESKVYVMEDATSLVSTMKKNMTVIKMQVENLKYDTIFYIMAVRVDNKNNFQLINSNGKWEYIYPLSKATIKDVTYTPTDAKIYINDVHRSKTALIGLTLTKGDKIRVMHKTPSTNTVFGCQFIIESTVLAPHVYG